MQNGRCVEQNAAASLLTAPQHPYTQRLLNSEPSGDPVPLDADSEPLLRVEGLGVSFPVRKGILRRVVERNPVLKDIRFSLRLVNLWGWLVSRVLARAPPVWRCCA